MQLFACDNVLIGPVCHIICAEFTSLGFPLKVRLAHLWCVGLKGAVMLVEKALLCIYGWLVSYENLCFVFRDAL